MNGENVRRDGEMIGAADNDNREMGILGGELWDSESRAERMCMRKVRSEENVGGDGVQRDCYKTLMSASTEASEMTNAANYDIY